MAVSILQNGNFPFNFSASFKCDVYNNSSDLVLLDSREIQVSGEVRSKTDATINNPDLSFLEAIASGCYVKFYSDAGYVSCVAPITISGYNCIASSITRRIVDVTHSGLDTKTYNNRTSLVFSLYSEGQLVGYGNGEADNNYFYLWARNDYASTNDTQRQSVFGTWDGSAQYSCNNLVGVTSFGALSTVLGLLGSNLTIYTGYSVTISDSVNGSASSDANSADEGDTVTITLTPDSGYEVDKENTTIGSTVAVAPQWDSDTQFHFTMPAANVTINPAFKVEQTVYKNTLTIVGDGTANLGPADAEIGATVTVNVNPTKGWHINKGATTLTSTVIVTPVWNSTDTQFTYTMPKANVTCTVTFTEDVKWNLSVGESEHGTAATVPADSCYAGDTVIVSFAPQTGYLVDRTLTSVMAGFTRVNLTWTGTNSAAFTAPDLEGVSGGIVVYPRFKEGDPYQPGGTSGAGGGGGTFSDSSDPIPPSPLPQVTVTNSGLVTLFRPSASQVASLGRYLWTNLTDFIENLQKMFSNPMDTFVAFNIVPCIPAVGTERKVQLGLWETDITMPPVVSQWYEFDFGSIFVAPYSGTFLDYAPNTKISMMLPYIGAVQLNTDEVMGQNISLRYRIDLLSGQCVALVMVNGDVYYQFTGECATAIPLTGSDWSRVYSAAVSAVGVAITGGVAAAGAGKAAAAFTGAQLVGSVSKATNAVAQAGNAFANVPKGVHGAPAMRQALVTASNQANDAIKDAATLTTNVSNGVRASSIARTVNNFVGDVMGAKAAVQHTGTMTGSAGMLGVRDAYLIIEYPNQSLPDNLKHYVGYPLNATRKLGDMKGYTVCEQVYPAQCTCLDTEYAEILDALKAGVYL